uniref:Uncharacterized protein n=1 Tax=Panagrolaimus sp. PS1159 TaxID=55785 RepID=A0AC35FRS8_9BILA
MMAAPGVVQRERRNSSIHEVSADFLRLNGSRQQFRNLLSARKKLGQMPPAYTRIDYSHDSIESNTPRIHPHGPVITVEDTAGSQVNLSFQKNSGMASPVPESLVSSFDRGYPGNNGSGSGGGENGTQGNNTLTVLAQTTKNSLNRNNSRYGVPIDESAVKLVYKQRSQRLNTRVQITDRCLILAITGIIFM